MPKIWDGTPDSLRSALGSALAEYRQSESGQAMVEYALVIAIIAVIAISGLSFLGITVKMQLHHISQGLTKGSISGT